jgi:cation diffusion facilitator CzcD-associated flavoprotein CzcO
MRQVKIAIIGAGFGGLGMAIRLREQGHQDLVILEKQADLGGVWHDNTYPGAGCDVPSHLYCFSFEPYYDWSRPFAPQEEIHAYLSHCADKYGIRPLIRFNTEVTSARFHEEEGRWHLETADGDRLSARILITATGQLNQPAIPNIPGLESFRGTYFHSARWNHDHDLNGRNVAVAGTGASAIQFVPRVAGQVRNLHLFQRSAAYVVPKPDKPWRAWQRRLMHRFPWLQRLDRLRLYSVLEMRALGFVLMSSLLKFYEWKFRWQLRRQVSDPALRRKLTPDYPLGCKRVLLANDYYPTLAKPHVEVINSGISEVRPDAVVAEDGTERQVDTIIFGTGFHATDFLSPMRIIGLNGRDLNQAWSDGAEAYLGITVHGFPNLFMLYGPNTNLGHSSIIYMLESQFRYILEAVTQLDDSNRGWLDVRENIQDDFNHELQRKMRKTVWQNGCESWYQTAEGKHTNNWPGFTFAYRQRTRHIDLRDYHLAGDQS